jgi:hypothetical protein
MGLECRQASIKTLKSDLGFSFEAQQISVLDPSAAILTVTALAFTGAAIIRKDKAAYTTTSLAASAATTKKEIKMSYVPIRTEIDRTLKPWPYHFSERDKGSVLRVLGHLDFEVPAAVTALAAAGEKLGSGGHRINLYDLDQKLAGYDIPLMRKMELKTLLIRQGLL